MKHDSHCYRINPNVDVTEFSEFGRSGQMLYTLKTKRSGIKRVVISSDAHRLLDNFKQDLLIESFPTHKDFLLRLIKLGILYSPQSPINDEENGEVKGEQKPSYMLFKVTLLSPKIVNRIAKYLLPFTQPVAVIICLFLMGSVGLYALFNDTPWNFQVFGSEQLLLTIFLSVFAIVVHEFGHATVAYRYGARRVSIGVGWYFIFPVAFADLSETWQLNVKQRLQATVAGIFYQSVYAAMVYIGFLYTANLCFYLASVAVLISVLWNLNPLLRLDGYWILSDLLNIPDLRRQAFTNALAFIKAPLSYRAKNKALIVLIYGLVSLLLLSYLLGRLAYELYRTQGFGIIEVYRKIYESSDWSLADWLLSIGTFAWKGLALVFLAVQVYLFIHRRVSRSITTPPLKQ